MSFGSKKIKLHPVHPGEVLLEEFLKPMGLSQNRLALDISVPPRRINEIVLGSGALARIRLSVWHATAAIRRSSGLGCRGSTIWISLKTL